MALIRGGAYSKGGGGGGGGAYFIFFQFVACHDHFSDTSSSINTKISSLLTKKLILKLKSRHR